jgi:hypothetical protein
LSHNHSGWVTRNHIEKQENKRYHPKHDEETVENLFGDVVEQRVRKLKVKGITIGLTLKYER